MEAWTLRTDAVPQGLVAGTTVTDANQSIAVLQAAGVRLDAVQKDQIYAALANPYVIPVTSLADVPGMSWTLQSSGTYCFNFELLITQAIATSIVGFGVNYTGGVSRFAATGLLANAVAAASFQAVAAVNTALLDNAARAIGGQRPARISGSITVSSPGILSLRTQRSAATTTVLAGSTGCVSQV